MVSPKVVDEQLKAIGAKFRILGTAEVRELSNVLVPGEVIVGALNGFYKGGYSLLCATNHRVILIDKKLMYLAIEDIRYETVNAVDFSSRLINSELIVHTPSLVFNFRSFSSAKLRQITGYIQEQMIKQKYRYNEQSYSLPEKFQYQTANSRSASNLLRRPKIGKFALRGLL